ncbi:hypothetical protein CKAN_00490200 [Cinnamomum micranthum f. kanehirae]|uniref:DUF4283 domain-containing protein n=1 Tax=Cinnamomum micranthum f. kanehirae TaxID=337451 RepID=A0A443ND49_9MAGN|nr:hypothetical protein CKAN_00490200 [Cinnamomum micranthum f. kanehirae]
MEYSVPLLGLQTKCSTTLKKRPSWNWESMTAVSILFILSMKILITTKSIPSSPREPLYPNKELSHYNRNGSRRWPQHETNRSYRDTVAPHVASLGNTLHDSVKSNIWFQEETNRSHAAPIVSFTASELESARKNHALTLIAQCQGTRVPTQVFLSRINQFWCARDKLSVVELQNNFLVCTFTDEKDFNWVRRGSPWKIAGQQVVVTNWIPNFDPTSAYIAQIPAWIMLPR